MTALPIIEQILGRVATALAAIKIANGYQVDIESVYRPAALSGYAYTPKHHGIALTLGDPARAPEHDLSGSPAIIAWDQPVHLDLIHRPSDAATTPIERALNILWADVQRAVMDDPTWEGYADDTTIADPEYWADEADGTCGITVVITLRYRVREDDPYLPYITPPAYTRIIDGGTAATADYDEVLSA